MTVHKAAASFLEVTTFAGAEGRRPVRMMTPGAVR
jgi:hypothetical protein